jgi:NADH-quinone oxidoreductase subunit D
MDLLELISGNRVNYAMCTIGGVRRDIPSAIIPKTLKILDLVDSRAKYYADVFLNDPVILRRSAGIGTLSKDDAKKYSIVGPTARASGVDYDIRAADPYAAYDFLDFKVITAKGGDVQARVVVRVLEIFESTKMLRQCLEWLQRNKGNLRKRVQTRIQEAEAVSRAEAPRGELFYYARSNGTDRPARIKIRTPTYANLLALKPMLAGQQLADLPIIVASIDPCFSCCERITLVDFNSGERKSMNRVELRKMGKNMVMK